MASKVLPSLNGQGVGMNQRIKSRVSPNSRGLPRRTDMIKVSPPDHPIQLKPRVSNRLFSEKPTTAGNVSRTPSSIKTKITVNSKSNVHKNISQTPKSTKTAFNQANPPSTQITVHHATANQQVLPSINSNTNFANNSPKITNNKSTPTISSANSNFSNNSPKISNNKSSPNLSHTNSSGNKITRNKSMPSTPKNSWNETKNEVKAQADSGNLEAMFVYANILFSGRGVIIDRTGAKKYFQKAADGGHCKAQIQYADMLLKGWGIPRNPQLACKYLTKAIESGNSDALYTLAGCFRDGNGVKKNLDEAEKLFRNGADQGHGGCQFELAQLLEMKGMEFKDEALSFYQKASSQNYPLASINFLRLLNKKT